jgi:hypothetical protein
VIIHRAQGPARRHRDRCKAAKQTRKPERNSGLIGFCRFKREHKQSGKRPDSHPSSHQSQNVALHRSNPFQYPAILSHMLETHYALNVTTSTNFRANPAISGFTHTVTAFADCQSAPAAPVASLVLTATWLLISLATSRWRDRCPRRCCRYSRPPGPPFYSPAPSMGRPAPSRSLASRLRATAQGG